MARVTQISKEELEPVVQARGKAVEAAQNADKALKDARLAELEFKVQTQQMFLEKGLDPNCRVDISNGTIAWPEEAVPAESSNEPKAIVGKKRAKKPAVIDVDADTDRPEAK